MAIGIRQHDPARDGTFEIEEYHPNFVEVYFVPPARSLLAAGLDPTQAASYRTKLLDINGQDNFLTIHPISTFGDKPGFLKPKYGRIARITLDNTDIIFPNLDGAVPTTLEGVLEVLEELPSGFTKDYAYGLGLAKPYRFIINAVEELSVCTEIVITGNQATGPDRGSNQIFYISDNDFEQARRAMNSIDNLAQSAARTVRGTTAYNIMAERLGVPKRDPKEGRHPYRKLFTAVAQGKEQLSVEDQNAVINALSNQAASIADVQPEKLAKLPTPSVPEVPDELAPAPPFKPHVLVQPNPPLEKTLPEPLPDPDLANQVATGTPSKDFIAQITNALAVHVGPFSKLIVEREMKSNPNVFELISKLEEHVPNADERLVFRVRASHINATVKESGSDV